MPSVLLSDLKTQATFLAGCAALIAFGGFLFGQSGGPEEQLVSLPFAVEDELVESEQPSLVAEESSESSQTGQQPVEFSVDAVPAVSDEQTIIVSGTASATTRVFSSSEQARQSDGRWTVPVVLVPGDNEVLIEGLGANGEIESKTFAVRFEPGTLAAVPFTAEQQFLASQDDEPWEYFSGTATPLSTVVVRSDYGTASVLADETGEWGTAVFFDAPGSEQPFPVVVEAVNGTATFEFTYVPAS